MTDSRRKKKKTRRTSTTTSRKNKRKEVVVEFQRTHITRIIGSFFALVGILLGLGIFNKAGIIGQGLEVFGRFFTGIGVYVLPLIFVAVGVFFIAAPKRRISWKTWVGSILATLSITGLAEVLINKFGGGGIIGQLVGGSLQKGLDIAGAVVVLVIALLVSIGILFPTLYAMIWSWITKKRSSENDTIRVVGVEDEPMEMEIEKTREPDVVAEHRKNPEPKVTGIMDKKKPTKDEGLSLDTSSPLSSDYTPPSLSLLSKSKGKPSVGDIKERAETIERTLRNFGIEITMDEISVGPTVTRYAMKPAVGTKLAKIRGLNSELALALAAHPIRIEAPIPGKSLVGIEIPNTTRSSVGLGSMLEEKEFKSTTKPLFIALGTGVSGKSFFANIAKMPHMLIAGATGSGKSVTAHTLIVSLLYQHGPEMLRFIMIDPKRVELTLYNKIPHLLTPVIKTAKKAILALAWATKEMDRRYDILEQYKVRDIGSYHDTIVKPAYAEPNPDDTTLPERMPYIVVIIDEMADLMQAYPRELEAQIVRLAQMSRAVGIHLILSTQRPSVNVITGLIKANIPARLALRVSSQIDSRTILDASGAETLLGAGDMLYSGGEMSKPQRIQGAFIPEAEVKKVVKAVIQNNRDYLPDEADIPETMDAGSTLASGSFEDDDSDELLPEARLIVIKTGKASTSYLQRKLRVGYSRAARLIDMLEDAGVVGPANGSKPRDVLITDTDEETAMPSARNDIMDEIPEDTDDYDGVPDELEI